MGMFSALKEFTGFNELPQPTAEFIKDFFIHYVEDNSDIIEACNNNIIPHPVISFDATFHIQKRTKVYKLNFNHSTPNF